MSHSRLVVKDLYLDSADFDNFVFELAFKKAMLASKKLEDYSSLNINISISHNLCLTDIRGDILVSTNDLSSFLDAHY